MSQDSSGMWANMLGLGPIMQTINDPGFHDQIRAFVAAITDIHARVARIEAKLDALLAREANDARAAAIAFAELGSDGIGTSPVASVAVDDGTGQPAATIGGAGNGVREVRPNRISGGVK